MQLFADIQSEWKFTEEGGKPKRFAFSPGYSGRKLTVDGFDGPVIVDLSKLRNEPDVQALFKHDEKKPVGTVYQIVNDGKTLAASGVLADTEWAEYVIKLRKSGFKWQASIGVYGIDNIEFIPKGKTFFVNGRNQSGPFYVIDGDLREISFVVLGGDPGARADLLAKLKGEEKMNWEEFLTKKGVKPGEGFDKLEASLREQYRNEFAAELDKKTAIKAELPEAAKPSTPELFPVQKVEATAGNPPTQIVIQSSPPADSGLASESLRVSKLEAILGDKKNILARAISSGWSSDDACEYLKACQDRDGLTASLGNESPSMVHREGEPARQDVVMASFAMECGVTPETLEKEIGLSQDAINRAMEKENRGFGPKKCVAECFKSYGAPVPDGLTFGSDNVSDALYICKQIEAKRRDERLSGRTAIKASIGFSTVHYLEVFEQTGNAVLIQSFRNQPAVYPQITKEVLNENFNVHESFQSTFLGKLQEISPTGQIQMGSSSTTKFVSQSKPMGVNFSIPEMLVINDSVGSFGEIFKGFGQAAIRSVEHTVFETLRGMIAGTILAQDGFAFFSEAPVSGSPTKQNRGNKITGTKSALNNGGLSLAEAAFDEFVDDNGDLIAATPSAMVVNSKLYVRAKQAYQSLEQRGGSGEYWTKNVFEGEYNPIKAPLLNASRGPGGSDSQWILVRSPQEAAMIQVVKLRGFSSPRVRRFDSDASVWGQTMQLIYPYNVQVFMPEGGVLCTGN